MLDADHMGRLSILAFEPLHGAARLSTLLGKGAPHVVVVPSHEMPADVVDIGSDVSYRDEATGRVHSVRLAMPQDADIRIRRVSVLTPVGTALIGWTEGAVINCEFPAGTFRRHYRIVVLTPKIFMLPRAARRCPEPAVCSGRLDVRASATAGGVESPAESAGGAFAVRRDNDPCARGGGYHPPRLA